MKISPTKKFHAATALLLMLLGLLVPANAQAVVTLRAATCDKFTEAFWPPYYITLNKPAGTVAGDWMIATIKTSGWYSSSGAPSGWTEQLSDGASSVTWVKKATASEPASYDFDGPSGGGYLAGGIATFTGVNTVTPFATAGVQTTSGSTAATVTLPDTNSLQGGSVRYSGITSGASVTHVFNGGLTELCDEKVGSQAVGMAYESVNSGTTPTRTVTRSATGSWVAHTLVLNPQVGTGCSAGGLNITSSPSFSFPATTLNGVDRNITTTAAVSVDDQTGTGAGWNLQATSTTMTAGAYTLPNTATTITGVTDTDGSGNCASATSSTSYPITLPANTTAPAATKIYSADATSGKGPVDLSIGLNLALPSRTHVGSYSSTYTLTLASGP